jgi:hypothetical protein
MATDRKHESENQGRTCPVCGQGTLADLAFDLEIAEGPGPLEQGADTLELTTYTCGHRVPGPSLGSADQERLDVERRESEESAAPLPEANNHDDRADS